MIDIKGAFIRWNTTKLTSKAGPFQHLITSTPRDLTQPSNPTFPYVLSTFLLVGRHSLVAESHQLLRLRICQETHIRREPVALTVTLHQPMATKDLRWPPLRDLLIILNLGLVMGQEGFRYLPNGRRATVCK